MDKYFEDDEDIEAIEREVHSISESLNGKRPFLTIKNRDGSIDFVAMIFALVTIGLLGVFIYQLFTFSTEPKPTFTFNDGPAEVLNQGDIFPGGVVIVSLEGSTTNLPGITRIFGQLQCESYFGIPEQPLDYSINIGGPEPTEFSVPWAVPIPEEVLPNQECTYVHATLLSNDSVLTVTSEPFTVGSNQP